MTPRRWEQVKSLLFRAAAAPRDARPNIMAEAADSRVASEVDRLLRHVDEAGSSFLGSPAMGGDWPEEPGPKLQAGDLLRSRFRIRRYMGRGGMGEVYEAEDIELGDPVALKLLPPDMASSHDTLRLFRQETQLARRVTHPNVCRVFDLARDTDPDRAHDTLHFLTMELLPGETLAAHLADQGAMTPAQALPLIEQIAAGLEAAHAAGIVHRDLKPSNIMLCPGVGGAKRAVIMDFGLAFSGADSASQSGLIAGTPSHMAPEQISGGEITAATDIYALGVVIYQMLAGELPFHRSSLTRLVEAAAQRDEKAFRPDAKDLPARWSRVILRCLEPEPAKRYASAPAVVSALKGISMARRTLLAFGLGTAAAGAYWWRQIPRRRQPHPEAEAAYQRGRLHAQRLTSPELKKGIAYFEQAIQIDAQFALAYSALADAYSRLIDYGGAPRSEANRKALEWAGKAVELDPDSGESHASLGLATLNDVNHWQEAEGPLRKALAINSRYGSARQWYASYLFRRSRTREAINEAAAAVEADPASLPVSYVLGFAYYLDKQYQRAIEHANRMIDLDPNFAYGYTLLARATLAAGELEQARKACAEGLSHSPGSSAFLALEGMIDGAGGRRESGLEKAKRLETLRHSEYLPAIYGAGVFASLGIAEEAFRWLERGFEDYDSSVLMVDVYPEFASLRRHSKYPALRQRFGFTQSDRDSR